MVENLGKWPSKRGTISKTGHRMSTNGMPFPWQWYGGTISMKLDVIWGMSVQRITQRTRSPTHSDWPLCVGTGGRIKSESLAALDRNHWPLCVGMRNSRAGRHS